MIGKEFPSEIKEYVDQKTGNVVKQLTSNGSNNHHFYFTDNSFSADDKEIYFLSDRSSSKPEVYNLFKMELETGQMVQLTNEPEGVAPSFHTKTPESDIVVYVSGRQLKKLDVSTLETTVLYEEKPGIQLGHPHISADKKYIGMARNERVPIERGANYRGFKETMYATKRGGSPLLVWMERKYLMFLKIHIGWAIFNFHLPIAAWPPFVMKVHGTSSINEYGF
ncbi:oligogalacturonate lyase family protein [Neobacillus rhizosphaerae]|uniref:TolB family protein n=1 Tax=Neobacillus rhizosphaerae TaxID=2880965 RepID=UPI003D2D0FEE